MLAELGLESAGVRANDDDAGDAVSPVGRPRDISPYLDIIRAYAGWAQLNSAAFAAGGLFDCEDPEVFCGQDPQDLSGQDVALVAMQTNGHIEFGHNGRELSVAFDRHGHNNAPGDFTAAGYAGTDLVVFMVLNAENSTAIEFSGGDFADADAAGRVRIVSDTALFVVPAVRDEQPTVRLVNQDDRWYCEQRPSGAVVCDEPVPWTRGQLDYSPAGSFLDLDDSLGSAPL